MKVVYVTPSELEVLRFAAKRKSFTSADLLTKLASTPRVFGRVKRLSEGLRLLDFDLCQRPPARSPVRVFSINEDGRAALNQLNKFARENAIDVANARHPLPLLIPERA